jgi:hypothetical protein
VGRLCRQYVELPGTEVNDGLIQFFPRVHHEGTARGDGFFDSFFVPDEDDGRIGRSLFDDIAIIVKLCEVEYRNLLAID